MSAPQQQQLPPAFGAEAAPPPLPDGWKQYTHPADQSIYYHNHLTGVSQYQHPGWNAPQQQQPPPAYAEPTPQPVPVALDSKVPAPQQPVVSAAAASASVAVPSSNSHDDWVAAILKCVLYHPMANTALEALIMSRLLMVGSIAYDLGFVVPRPLASASTAEIANAIVRWKEIRDCESGSVPALIDRLMKTLTADNEATASVNGMKTPISDAATNQFIALFKSELTHKFRCAVRHSVAFPIPHPPSTDARATLRYINHFHACCMLYIWISRVTARRLRIRRVLKSRSEAVRQTIM